MATAKIRKQVYWQQDERVDTPDMTAAQTFARLRSQDTVQFLAGRAPRVGHTGRTWMPYSVWALNGSGITFEPATDNRIKVAAGLRLALTGGDSGDAGDMIEVSEETILDNFCPGVGTPLLLLMARISTSLVSGDSDDRVFYKTSDQTEETRNEPTTQRRDINWSVVDAADGAAITVAETAGYQWVAELDYNGGTHQVSAWYYVFPESEVGGGALTESVLAAVWGLKRGLEAAYGGGKAWTDTPDNTLEDDELHATTLWGEALAGGTSVPDSTTVPRFAWRASPAGKTGALLEAAAAAVALGGVANYLLDVYRTSDTSTIWRFLDPRGDLSDPDATHTIDHRFGAGVNAAAWRATKDSSGRRVLQFLTNNAAAFALREDKRVEIPYLARVVRDLPIEYARPAEVLSQVPQYLTITHAAVPAGGVLRIAALGIGSLAQFGGHTGSGAPCVLVDDGGNWTWVAANTTGPQVYVHEAAANDTERFCADLSSYNGGRDLYVVFSSGYRMRVLHDAGAAGYTEVKVHSTLGLQAILSGASDVTAAPETVRLWLETTGKFDKLWEWQETVRRWATVECIYPATVNMQLATLRLPVPRSYAGVGGVRNERLVSVTADCQAVGAATRLRMFIYEGTDSVGVNGAVDYVEWLPTETGEKTLAVDPALLDADGTTTQLAVVWQVYASGAVPNALVKRARETTDVYLMPGR